jgi:hypothetical protein
MMHGTTNVKCVSNLNYAARNAHAPYFHVACPALQYFSILSHKRHDLKKYIELRNVCFDFFYNIFMKHFTV